MTTISRRHFLASALGAAALSGPFAALQARAAVKNGNDTVWQEAALKGAARIVRGEGCWFGNGLIYLSATGGAAAGEGQVFALDPVGQTLACVFASPGAAVLDNPDNITVSPRGGLVLCETATTRSSRWTASPRTARSSASPRITSCWPASATASSARSPAPSGRAARSSRRTATGCS
jgi:uncharacterized protein DUF839